MTLAGLDGMTHFPDRQADRSRPPLDEIAFFEPPHYRQRARPSTDLTSRCGIVATVRLHEEHFTPDALPHTIAAASRLRDGLPRAPLLAFLPEWPEFPNRSFVRGLRSLPARAVLPGEPPPSLAELRHVVTSRAGLLEDVSGWFRAHVALDPDELQAGLSLVAAGLEAAPTDPLPRTRSPEIQGGATRRSWHMLGRGIKAALLLQREPDINLIEAAHALKFHDGSGLTRHFTRVFGRQPSFLRWRLSWEWLLDDWARDNLGRGALSPVRSSTPAEVATAGRRLA